MSKVDNKICLEMLKLGLRTQYQIPNFQGLAENWEKFSELDFQTFAKKHDINAKTNIAIYDKGSDVFAVQIVN